MLNGSNSLYNTLMSKFYITTTLPYVNALPHIGHTLEFLQADVIARYMRTRVGASEVFFNIGTDEHGQKIYTKAIEEGLTPQEFVDKYVSGWKDFCELYQISYTNFYRTSDQRHVELAKKLWQILVDKGQIYKKKYAGLYCVGCESFKMEKELVDGKCPDHDKAPIPMEEENYFLKLSEHTEKILDHIEKNKEFVKSPEKQKHLVNFLKEGLQDISVSRLKEKLPWGIDIPGDDKQVMYVWLDALSNYIFAVDYLQNEENYKKLWPGVQICGPDNLKFQGAIWQGILAALEEPFTKKILVHGMINDEHGRKMSKTLGNVISPFEILEKYGLKAVRYYLTVGIPTYDDAAFSETRLVDLYNDGLADKYGNLLNRVIHLANKNSITLGLETEKDPEIVEKVNATMKRYHELMGEYELSEAFQCIYELSSFGNEYISIKQPWGKDKSINEITVVLNSLAYILEAVIAGYEPILLETTQIAKDALKSQSPVILFDKITVSPSEPKE